MRALAVDSRNPVALKNLGAINSKRETLNRDKCRFNDLYLEI